MNFTFMKKDLLPIIEKLATVIPVAVPKDVLKCFKLELSDNELTITATDATITLVLKANVQSSDKDLVVIDARKFYDIIKRLSSKTAIKVIDKGKELEIQQGRFKIDIVKYYEPYDFPKNPDNIVDGTVLDITGKKLTKYIQKTLFAVSSDDLRAVLTGVLFSFGDEFRMVATDSVILVGLKDSNIKVEKAGDYIVPHKTLKLLQNILNDNSCKIMFAENYCVIELSDGSVLYSRLINGKYPAYQAIIPVNNDKVMQFKKGELVDSLNKVALSCNPLTRLIKVDIGIHEALLSAEDSTTSSRSEDICSVYTENIDNMTIGFNQPKIVALLNNIKNEEIKAKISEPTRPVIFEPVNELPYKLISLIMPVKVVKS